MTHVKLEVEGRSWSRVIEAGDPVFAPLLEPYIELDGDLPAKILLTGAVGEIFDEEWHYYKELPAIMKNGSKVDYGEGRAVEPYADTPWTLAEIATVDKYRDEDKLKYEYHFQLFLHNIHRIVRILNMPEGWEKYVAVTGATPERDRLAHLVACGEAIEELRDELEVRRYIYTYSDIPATTREFAMRYLAMIAQETMNSLVDYPEDKRREAIDAVRVTFFGVARNAVLTAYYREHTRVEWDDVLWGDIRALLERSLGLWKITRPIRTADVLGGVKTQGEGPTYTLSGSIASIHNLRLLYERLASSMPSDVTLDELGLTVIVLDTSKVIDSLRSLSWGKEHKELVIGEVVSLVNRTILAEHLRLDKDGRISTKYFEEDIKRAVADFKRLIGEASINLLYTGLANYLEWNEYNERASVFLVALEKWKK